MILSKRDLKRLIETVINEQDDDNIDDATSQSDENEEEEKFKEIKFYLPKKFINKLVDDSDPVGDEEEMEIILKPDGGKLVYTVDGNPPPDLKPIKVLTVVGLGMIYGVDENGDKEKIADRLKDILVLDKTFANKSVGRMKEILTQKIKLGRFNFGKDKIRDAFNL
jgi:hypothetical protein|tara:strand:- start:2212 stop:2709 length:498 start_codon:yes stop_codon:yes gene_type:complete